MEIIAEKNYNSLLPMNEKYGKWLDDKVTMGRIYQPFAHLFETIYFTTYKHDGTWQIISKNSEESFEAMLQLIKEKDVILTDSQTDAKRIKITAVAGNRDGFKIDHQVVTKDEVRKTIFASGMVNDNFKTDVNLLLEVVKNVLPDEGLLKIYLLNTRGNNPIIGDCFLMTKKAGDENCPLWRKVTKEDAAFIHLKQIEKELADLCLYTPQLEFFSVDLMVTTGGFKIIQMNASPSYPKNDLTFSPVINEYLQDYLRQKKTHLSQTDEWWKKERLAKMAADYPRGFYPFLESPADYSYIPTFNEQLLTEDGQLVDDWAKKRGFLPQRLAQYGHTLASSGLLISDFEYEYLGHINNKYRHWFEDKLTIKYVLREFSHQMPAYYYSIFTKEGKNRIIPLMDCPATYEGTFDDIFKLVREMGVLALKPDEGTHGAGFIKFSYLNGVYYFNEKEVSVAQVMILLNDVNNQYLITEFITQHPDIANIYSGSVNTARITVFKEDGKRAVIGHAYMRFGTNETGGVDNIGAGGIGADIDLSSGFFGNAKKLDGSGKIRECFYHPDTGVLIQGYLPHWEKVTQEILNMANAVPEIEYMGFDVAFTTKGIKLPEINRFPDYPKINALSPRSMNYLMYKLKQKKRAFGYEPN